MASEHLFPTIGPSRLPREEMTPKESGFIDSAELFACLIHMVHEEALMVTQLFGCRRYRKEIVN